MNARRAKQQRRRPILRPFEQDPHTCGFCGSGNVTERYRGEPLLSMISPASEEIVTYGSFTCCAGCAGCFDADDFAGFLKRTLPALRHSWPAPVPPLPPATVQAIMLACYRAYAQVRDRSGYQEA